MRTKKQEKSEGQTSTKSKRKSGAYCVYFTYKKGDDTIPQIITCGSEEQCRKHVEDYNRQTLELYRCKLYVAPSKEILDRIAELKKRYGFVGDSLED